MRPEPVYGPRHTENFLPAKTMNDLSLQSPCTQFTHPVVATVRRERSTWRAEFSPVKTRMLNNSVASIGYAWFAPGATRSKSGGR
jgi:hypothetical protein